MNAATRLFDCADSAQHSEGVEQAAAAVGRGELVVLPTDTVYGIGADAFMPSAVAALLAAKGRSRQMPPPVLVGSVRAAFALVDDLGLHGKDLIEEFWPGGLTLVCHAARTLSWDLGDTRGTVAVRMPLHPVALELLKQTGPMAVSSANRSGEPPATTAAGAEAQLGESVAVYLDGGPCAGGVPSSIVDLTGPVPRLLRAGAVSAERLRMVAPLIDGTGLDGGDDLGASAVSGDDPTASAVTGDDPAASAVSGDDPTASAVTGDDPAASAVSGDDPAASAMNGDNPAGSDDTPGT